MAHPDAQAPAETVSLWLNSEPDELYGGHRWHTGRCSIDTLDRPADVTGTAAEVASWLSVDPRPKFRLGCGSCSALLMWRVALAARRDPGAGWVVFAHRHCRSQCSVCSRLDSMPGMLTSVETGEGGLLFAGRMSASWRALMAHTWDLFPVPDRGHAGQVLRLAAELAVPGVPGTDLVTAAAAMLADPGGCSPATEPAVGRSNPG